MSRPLTIALVAGEASGDQLGGQLIPALAHHFPNAKFVGIGGNRMRAAGMNCWWDRRVLSVMGLFEVIKHLPRLLRLRKKLRQKLLAEKPDLFIGIDAPDFNLGLEKSLRKAGIPTIHYVSPTVWAWRSGRARKIGESADLVLCLFPFEPAFYREHGVQARYTGHPLADIIDEKTDKAVARSKLGLENSGPPLVALLPGSRASEVERLAQPLLAAAGEIARRDGGARFVAALADEETAAQFAASPGYREADCPIVIGNALGVMAAADVVVVASGTASLECMLVNRPMVVVYRLAGMTYWTADVFNLVKSRFVSLPNILAGQELVPELLQDAVTAPEIAKAVATWLEDKTARDELTQHFSKLHADLRCDAAASAAQAIADFTHEHRSNL